MKNIDLHVHSTASDGSCTPSEIIDMAEEMDLAAIALTDHDTVSGLDEFRSRAEHSSVKIIPGVEVAVNWNNKELHILGFFIDDKNEELLNMLSEIRGNRDGRNSIIIQKLCAAGYDITIDDIMKEAGGESIGRPHIAKVLIKKGYFKEPKDVFDSCLARGGSCYVARILPDPETAISTIHKSGGIALWAHPVHRNKSKNKELMTTIDYFKNLGLDGIEGYYPEYTAHQHRNLLQIADKLGFAISGGSDFHGTNQPHISLGTGRGDLEVPEIIYNKLVEYHKSKFCNVN